MNAALIDKKTREKWLAEFAIWAVGHRYDIDLTMDVLQGEPFFWDLTTEIAFDAYVVGRLHQIDAAAVAGVQKKLDAIARHDLGGA